MKNYKDLCRPSIVVILEPRISGAAVDLATHKLGFSYKFRVEANGFSGGIWTLWDSSCVTLTPVSHSPHFLHFKVTGRGGRTFHSTAIYGSPTESLRRVLWSGLGTLASGIDGPWLIGGDFNAILGPSDKLGGTPFRLSRCREFQDCINICGLMDGGFTSPRFTWTNGTVKERLDRVLLIASA
ncbi:hypothetical protein LINGRAHAP2_LOCUS19863 [Linum grandiflorum]